jgi:hypothetical protein
VIAAQIEGTAATAARALVYVSEACRNVAGWLRRTACGLTGHEMVRHFEPHRMSLQCLSCGAETAGWLLEEEPPMGACAETRSPDWTGNSVAGILTAPS